MDPLGRGDEPRTRLLLSIGQISFARESWTAPVDAERVHPAEDANEVVAEQMKAFLCWPHEEGSVPLFVFDTGYAPVKLQQGLEGSPCQILVPSRACGDKPEQPRG